MKKSLKITLIIIGVFVGLIILDTTQAIVFNNSPIIRITKTYSNSHKKHIGVFVETDIYDGVTQTTRFKWETHTLPIIDNTDNLKDTYKKVSDYFGSETTDRSNLGSCSLDESNNVVVVTLIDNSKTKQEEFIKNANINPKYVKFEQGGPYTTSAFDFYITKPESHTDIRFNDYYTTNDRTIYLAGNIGELYIKDQDKDITLKTYLSTAFQTLDDGIKHITDKLELKATLKDGGTKIYKSKNKDITMIVCNTTKNDKNILIGDYSMEYTEGDCNN